jgi:hypothetical protein
MVPDFTIRTYVDGELEHELRHGPARIRVRVVKGAATLGGCVASRSEKAAFKRAAGRAIGVKSVIDEIEVRQSVLTRRAGDEIAPHATDCGGESPTLAIAMRVNIDMGGPGQAATFVNRSCRHDFDSPDRPWHRARSLSFKAPSHAFPERLRWIKAHEAALFKSV